MGPGYRSNGLQNGKLVPHYRGQELRPELGMMEAIAIPQTE